MEERKCSKCGVTNREIKNKWFHRHHVLYATADITERVEILCKNCHSKITKINTKYRKKVKRPLSWKEREDIYGDFLIGKYDKNDKGVEKRINEVVTGKKRKQKKKSKYSLSKLWGFWDPSNDN